ncbi:hypothetical protein LPJ53_001743 [Coemansia erecta]|uniref:Uncharacterized protein n=1 Tax=Coemansia erecta TaxID=147472 RepID=A0A9W8CUL3_9FUNG|nr:hypothetical protein LPJ53_001743 [Coemansia erecta]
MASIEASDDHLSDQNAGPTLFEEETDEYSDADQEQDIEESSSSKHAMKLKDIRKKVKEMTAEYLDKLVDDGEITGEDKNAVSLELAAENVPGLKRVAANVNTLARASHVLAKDNAKMHKLHMQKADCIMEIEDLQNQLEIAEEKKQMIERKLRSQIERLKIREHAVRSEVMDINLMEQVRMGAFERQEIESELDDSPDLQQRMPMR